MTIYIGMDLGTTNSCICSFDGEKVKIYKSAEQNDVTPSAIFIDKRSKYLGERAYNAAARSPDNAATKFKRLIGTSTPIKLPAVNIVMTPEECSAEILQLCYGYLPEELRNNPDTGTVITVPAAFNQMQLDGTRAAAELAGLGKVALMQEPVAAVMAVVHQRPEDGLFVVFDLGGGTLDISVAESMAGRVSLLSHGGVAMLGGTDFDRLIVDSIVKPWLSEHFSLPSDFAIQGKYKTLLRMATWAAEKAKIALSSRDEAIISLSETELNLLDEKNQEIYLDIPLNRASFERLIAPKLQEAIAATREALEKANQQPENVSRLVFVGGPTQYPPLREKVAFEMGIAASTEVNPMTAVAEGAAIFAESIDWSTQNRSRKSARGTLNAAGPLNLSFNFASRTPASRAKVIVKMTGMALPGSQFQIESLDTGWSSGRMDLADGAAVELVLGKAGENTFKAFLFDPQGGVLPLENNKFVITQTAATIDAIPASASIGIEVTGRGRNTLSYLVREGDPLPKKGVLKFLAGEALRAGDSNSLHFILREGEIEDPVSDNECIGELRIDGTDIDEGTVAKGAELVCEYEIMDSGQIVLNVSIPSIGGMFGSGRNFYSRKVGGRNYTDDARHILLSAQELRRRVNTISEKVVDDKIDQARTRLTDAETLDAHETDPEVAKQAMDDVQAAKKLLAQVRKKHTRPIRQIELDACLEYFDGVVRKHARPNEETAYDTLARTAQRAIDNQQPDFERLIDQLRIKNFDIMWRNDWFVIDRFRLFASQPWRFIDAQKHTKIVVEGTKAVDRDDVQAVRYAVYELYQIIRGNGDDVQSEANIVGSGQ